MVVQGRVDHSGKITNINAEWFEKVHDLRTFQNSALFTLMNNGEFALRIALDINDVTLFQLT